MSSQLEKTLEAAAERLLKNKIVTKLGQDVAKAIGDSVIDIISTGSWIRTYRECSLTLLKKRKAMTAEEVVEAARLIADAQAERQIAMTKDAHKRRIEAIRSVTLAGMGVNPDAGYGDDD